MSVNTNPGNYSRLRSTRPKVVAISAKKERDLSIKKVSVILQKDESLRTKEENDLLFNYSEIVKEAALRIEKRKILKERLKEVEDSDAVLDAKCKQLAEAIDKAQYLVAYTGAGISTAARIPDYRGASGIWTLLQQGKDIGTHDLTQADPTYTHMALYQLYSLGKLKHVVSQNCDGLHLRSGLPKKALSEVHGNMYIEVCRSCRPIIEYLRLFDVTENTGRYSHKTMRKCYKCNSSLVDSIVHFGERGNLPWPLNWKGACKAAEKADMILCIGSSLKVLKRYPWLWCMDKPVKRRPHIYIVNLQWTPKDCNATIKINGKCDTVMEKLMKYLSISVPTYSRNSDPIFKHATDLCKEERHTKNRPLLTLTKLSSAEEIKIKSESCKEKEIVTKSAIEESCVTSCKKEVFIDTGQEGVKCVREELILITIRSGDDLKDCCSLFKDNQSHHSDCVNFVDAKNDIPVIMEEDLVAAQIKREIYDIKVENEEISNQSFNKLDNSILSNQVQEIKANIKFEIHDNQPKKPKLCEEAEKKPKNSSPVLESGICRNNPKRKIPEPLKCKYCLEKYSSNTCLFYMKREPVFKGNVPVCDCCSSEEEEEEQEGSEEKVEEETSVQYKTNPGWYGKGLRKNFRRKR